VVFVHAEGEYDPSPNEWLINNKNKNQLLLFYLHLFDFSVRTMDRGDGDTKPFLYNAPTAFLNTALLTPGNSSLISDGDDLSPTGSVPLEVDCKRSSMSELISSAFAFPPKARKPMSIFPSSSLRLNVTMCETATPKFIVEEMMDSLNSKTILYTPDFLDECWQNFSSDHIYVTTRLPKVGNLLLHNQTSRIGFGVHR
jgi:hypothetical protein